MKDWAIHQLYCTVEEVYFHNFISGIAQFQRKLFLWGRPSDFIQIFKEKSCFRFLSFKIAFFVDKISKVKCKFI
jgi:hypothetical protein